MDPPPSRLEDDLPGREGAECRLSRERDAHGGGEPRGQRGRQRGRLALAAQLRRQLRDAAHLEQVRGEVYVLILRYSYVTEKMYGARYMW